MLNYSVSNNRMCLIAAGIVLAGLSYFAGTALAENSGTHGSRPNILMIVSDDTGYWDLGPYLGGASRGMNTRHSTNWHRQT